MTTLCTGIALGLLACGAPTSSNDSTSPPSSDSIPHQTATTPVDTTPAGPPSLLVWVDQLNAREQPNLKSPVLVQFREGESVRPTGERSNFTERIELRGQSFEEPWLEVAINDGRTAWVFAGGLRRPGEVKGPSILPTTQLDYTHFGSFDLTTWKRVARRDEGEEEVDVLTEVYEKEGRQLEVSLAERGEFYYGWSYALRDAKGELLKQRRLEFTADTDFNELSETVVDYTVQPPREYRRVQTLSQHFSQLPTKPDRATGEWTVKSREEYRSEPAPTAAQFTAMAAADCREQWTNDRSCACDFKSRLVGQDLALFSSDMEQSACVSINGRAEFLSDRQTDGVKQLKALAQAEHWITLPARGPIRYFGQPLSHYGYEDERDLLIDVLLATGREYDRIPIDNQAEGMAVREVRDLAQDALDRVKALRAKGLGESLYHRHYGNERYEVLLRTRRTTNYEGEANVYEGELILKAKGGTAVLDRRAIGGTCGC